MSDERARALAFARETNARCADLRERWEHGLLLRTPSLDAVWSVNNAYVERPARSLSADDVEALLARRFAGGRFASATIEDEETAARIEPAARERGWRVEHELFMVLRGRPRHEPGSSEIREGTEAELAALLSRWFAEDFADQGPEALRQLDEFARRQRAARPRRAFVSPAADATVSLLIEDGVVEVEDVYALPEARGRGHARALLTHALAAARAADGDLVFLVADDDDTPKDLYARLGFAPLTRVTRVVREA
ncbi:MAG TPA: GNAT family N-acetyltransferase [Solirubrobacteraceae bacterium]|nr:GNAT family N-acetyltransferase [Solirubrobacteraceae bacterium]